MSFFCAVLKCGSVGVVGGYCLEHQTERANAIQAQLDQRNDSSARMSREITERMAHEAQLTQRAEAAERRADELVAQLATANAEATRLARELAVAQQERDTARAERDVAMSELRERREEVE